MSSDWLARLSNPAEGTEQDLAGRRYAIVGGGISGLAAAWYLQQRGAETHIIEREAELGGRVASAMLGDRMVTLGGKNIGRTYTRFRAFAASHGSPAYEEFGINSSRVVDGQLVKFDSKRRLRLLAEARRIPPRDALRLIHLIRKLRRQPGARHLNDRACAELAERWGAVTLSDRFGVRLCELILRSLTVRVSAAEPDEVPIANVLPYLAMLLDTYDQLADGMHLVIEEAGRCSRLSLGTEATGLIVDGRRVCGVELRTLQGRRRRECFDGVILATSAHVSANLLATPAPMAAARLREVRYYPLAVLIAEYEQPVFTPDHRAIVFGADQVLSNAGAYGIQDLNLVRYTFSGRRARTLLESRPDAELLASIGERTLASHANLAANHRRATVSRRFAPGLCAYHLDQAQILKELSSSTASLERLALAGDYLCGCSIESCFAAAERAVTWLVTVAPE